MPSEALVKDKISPESICGLVVAEQLLEKKINEINFFKSGATGTFHIRC
jgi:hypothetical protein